MARFYYCSFFISLFVSPNSLCKVCLVWWFQTSLWNYWWICMLWLHLYDRHGICWYCLPWLYFGDRKLTPSVLANVTKHSNVRKYVLMCWYLFYFFVLMKKKIVHKDVTSSNSKTLREFWLVACDCGYPYLNNTVLSEPSSLPLITFMHRM